MFRGKARARVFSNLNASVSRQRQRVPNETENREYLRDGWNRTSEEGKTIPGMTNTRYLVKIRVRCWHKKLHCVHSSGCERHSMCGHGWKASVGITGPLLWCLSCWQPSVSMYLHLAADQVHSFCGYNWALPAIYHSVTFHLNGLYCAYWPAQSATGRVYLQQQNFTTP